MLWLDIINSILTALVIIVTSVILEKLNHKTKVITVIIAIALCLGGQIWALIENAKDRKISEDTIIRRNIDLADFQRKLDTAIMQRDTTIRLAKMYIDQFLDSLENHGVHYDRVNGKVKIQNQNQQININQSPLINIEATKLNFQGNEINNQIYITPKTKKND